MTTRSHKGQVDNTTMEAQFLEAKSAVVIDAHGLLPKTFQSAFCLVPSPQER